MPELAEVEFFRKEWDPGVGHVVTAVALHQGTRLFRSCAPVLLRENLPRARLIRSEAHGKRLLFRFRKDGEEAWSWLGLHLGMSGKLRCERDGHRAEKHDHLVLAQRGRALVFSDPRQFGRVEFAVGSETPAWWRNLPPPILSSRFTRERMELFLARHGRAPVKAMLLMQEGFPGLGNWMVDEISWRAQIDPARAAGSLSGAERKKLYRSIRMVCRIATTTIAIDFRDPPADWLFHQRWSKGGRCPRTGEALRYDQVAGRTTCWSPANQR